MFDIRLKRGPFYYMEIAAREAWTHRISAALSHAPDIAVIALWAALAGYLATLRYGFTGDGIRHLAPILNASRPMLGEPRWLFFPALLFAVIKPLQLAGLVNTVEQAAHAFAGLDLLAGAIYMMLIRRWLMVRSIGVRERTAALLLAGMTLPMLSFAGDTVEPMVPATIALAGLVYAASQPSAHRQRGLVVAAIALVIATLLYQGLFLAVAMVPCAIPRRPSPRFAMVVVFALILSLAPLTMFATMVAAGRSSAAAIHQMLTGEENDLYKAQMKSKTRPVWQYVAAATVGPAESIIPIPESRGITGALKLIARRATIAEGLFEMTGFLLALGLYFSATGVIVRRRDWRLGVALGGILVLPIVRSFQYSYLKFYVLMPAVLALIASTVSPIVALPAAIVAGTFNTVYLAREIAAQRRLSDDIAPLFDSASSSACYLTTSWGAPTMEWPGSLCSFNAILSRDSAEQVALIASRNQRAMLDSMRRCFCGSSTVLTDDLNDQNHAVVAELLKYYRFDGFKLGDLQWNQNRGTLVFDADGMRVFVYSRAAQAEICSKLNAVAR